ncbi:unnamed protein product [Meganyctiphanes norvegica]|uniref:Uncharacterized protein n=1 Tax=Meganyctiphanes norvegica TaxID=48144 RepID=A0AAV2QWI0_MEGNR
MRPKGIPILLWLIIYWVAKVICKEEENCLLGFVLDEHNNIHIPLFDDVRLKDHFDQYQQTSPFVKIISNKERTYIDELKTTSIFEYISLSSANDVSEYAAKNDMGRRIPEQSQRTLQDDANRMFWMGSSSSFTYIFLKESSFGYVIFGSEEKRFKKL